MRLIARVVEHETVQGKRVTESVGIRSGFSAIVEGDDVVQWVVSEQGDLMNSADGKGHGYMVARAQGSVKW